MSFTNSLPQGLSAQELLSLLREREGLSVPTLCVTGGKGGTGKSTVATNLAAELAARGRSVLLLDLDVDEPNDHLLLGAKPEVREPVREWIPKIDPTACIKCGSCARACRTHALVQAPGKAPIFLQNLCAGCRACQAACPVGAVLYDWVELGWTYSTEALGIKLIWGELSIGERESAKVVSAAKERARSEIRGERVDLVIVDTAPGAHVDVAKSIAGCDVALAVTEPTPFGAHDLDRILRLAEALGVRAEVVLNRSDLVKGRGLVESVCSARGVRIVAEIPTDPEVLSSYLEGRPAVLSKSGPGVEALKKLADDVERWLL